MTDNRELIIKHNIDSSSCLERAKKLLESFDNGSIESLFYAALELRMGIEARLYAYIDASVSATKRPTKPIKEYSATKLLNTLSRIDPNSKEPLTMLFGLGKGSHSTRLEYTPVTRKIASDHGKLGEILHHAIFRNNKHWYIRKELSPQSQEKSLVDFRIWLGKVSDKLEEANRGLLLNHPEFLEFIEKLEEEQQSKTAETES